MDGGKYLSFFKVDSLQNRIYFSNHYSIRKVNRRNLNPLLRYDIFRTMILLVEPFLSLIRS
jgi:hypothetical protein